MPVNGMHHSRMRALRSPSILFLIIVSLDVTRLHAICRVRLRLLLMMKIRRRVQSLRQLRERDHATSKAKNPTTHLHLLSENRSEKPRSGFAYPGGSFGVRINQAPPSAEPNETPKEKSTFPNVPIRPRIHREPNVHTPRPIKPQIFSAPHASNVEY